MADGGLVIELDAALGARLKEAAEAVGRSVEDHASVLIAQGLADDWAEARASLADYDRTGEHMDARTALADFRADLFERLERRR